MYVALSATIKTIFPIVNNNISGVPEKLYLIVKLNCGTKNTLMSIIFPFPDIEDLYISHLIPYFFPFMT